jgi:cell division septal protein FtsQ
LSIASVGVVGAEDISPRLVKAYFESELFDGTRAFFSRYNIFLFPRETLEERLMEHFPHIRSAKISRDALLAQAVVVTVEEREPRGRWCDVGRCYYLDDKGFIFAPAPGSDPTLYTFTGALASGDSPIGQTFLPERFPQVLTLLLKLKDAGFASVGLSLESEEDFSIPLARGYAIRAPLAGDFEKIVHNLQLVLSSDALRGKESQLEYIDLRFGNRVYYKFKNSEAVSVE